MQLQGLGSNVSSPSRVWGSPGRNRIWCILALKYQYDIWYSSGNNILLIFPRIEFRAVYTIKVKITITISLTFDPN